MVTCISVSKDILGNTNNSHYTFISYLSIYMKIFTWTLTFLFTLRLSQNWRAMTQDMEGSNYNCSNISMQSWGKYGCRTILISRNITPVLFIFNYHCYGSNIIIQLENKSLRNESTIWTLLWLSRVFFSSPPLWIKLNIPENKSHDDCLYWLGLKMYLSKLFFSSSE